MNIRRVALGAAMTPAWLAYLLALAGLVDERWLSVEALKRAMDVEYIAVIAFPFLGGLAAMPDRRPSLRPWRWLAWFALAAAITGFIAQALGPREAVLFWIGSGLTYLGWLVAPPVEGRWRTLFSRFLLSFASLVVIVFAVIVLEKITRGDAKLLLGFCYFLALQVLELSGAFARFHRALEAASRR